MHAAKKKSIQLEQTEAHGYCPYILYAVKSPSPLNICEPNAYYSKHLSPKHCEMSTFEATNVLGCSI